MFRLVARLPFTSFVLAMVEALTASAALASAAAFSSAAIFAKVEFKFSELAQPYVFDLHRDYYSFHLRELANIKGKYTLILLKLWEAKRYKNNKLTLLEGNLEEWQTWFLGKDKRISAGEFKRSVLEKAINELEKKINANVTLTTKKRGRNVTGYEIEIIDGRKNVKNN